MKIGGGDLIRDHMGGEEVLWSARRVALLGRPTAGTLDVISGICMPSLPCSWTFASLASQHQMPCADELAGGR